MAEGTQSRNLRVWLRLTAMALLLCTPLLDAQTVAPGSLAGKLTDTHSQPLVGAKIVVRNTTTGFSAQTLTGKNGSYRLTGLEPGEYILDAESSELGHGQLEEIFISSGHEARVQAVLNMELPPPAPIRASLSDLTPTTPVMNTTISAEPLQAAPLQAATIQGTPPPAAPVQAAPVRIATTPGTSPPGATALQIESAQASPSAGRNWQNFALDSPTASLPHENPNPKGLDATESNSGGADEGVGLRGVNGVQPTTTVDGMNSTPGFKSRGWGRGGGSPMAHAAISRVEAQAGNGEIESSHSPAGRLSALTRPGTNGLHGQVFFYDRGSVWGAQNPFTQLLHEGPPVPTPYPGTNLPTFTASSYTPQNLEMTGGLGVGGSLRRNRVFWFVAIDGYYRNNPAVASARHPDLFFAEPTACGQGAPCKVGFQDLMQTLASRLALPAANPFVEGVAAYRGMLETLNGLLGPTPRSAKQWIGFGRLDWKATERDHLTAEGSGALWNSPNGVLTRTLENFGNHSFGNARASEEWALGRWERFFTANLQSVSQGSWARDVLSQSPSTSSAFEQTLMDNVWGRVPQIVVDSRNGFSIGTPARVGNGSYPDERRIEANQQLYWVHHGHLVKLGFEYRHVYDRVGVLLNQTGTYHYSSVYNFISDALAYQKFGLAGGQLNPFDQHNCDQTGKVWRDSNGELRGRGNLPCYNYYSQTIGPVGRALSTNDWAAYISEQWQPRKHLTLSAALRWERQQLPPPITALVNAEIPGTAQMPQLGNEWAPRLSMAWASGDKPWPVVRLGYGMYYGRTQNATLETVLTHTGSLKGDMNFFVRPTDNLTTGGAPPFPYVFAGPPLNLVKPGAIEFAPHFRNIEVHQAIIAVEESLPGHVQVTASGIVSLGRRLPLSIDTNIDPAINPQTITYEIVDGGGKGPIKQSNIAVPLYASWPSGDCPVGAKLNLMGQCGRLNPHYQQIAQISSKANSTYEAAMLRATWTGRNGIRIHAHYIYSHAMDWNPNETTLVGTGDVLDPDPRKFSLEYGTSDLDVRHALGATVEWRPRWRLHGLTGKLMNGWHISIVGHIRSGRPYTIRTGGSLPKEIESNGSAIVGLAPGMNGSGGDNRIYWIDADNKATGLGRNTYRYPATWKADLRLSKHIDLGGLWELELLSDSFNLLNHQNVTDVETVGYTIEAGTANGPPRLNFMTGLKANTTEFGMPRNVNGTNYYRPRQFELGARMRF